MLRYVALCDVKLRCVKLGYDMLYNGALLHVQVGFMLTVRELPLAYVREC